MDEELLQTLSRALTHLVYRNTVVEDLHAEGVCLDDETMKEVTRALHHSEEPDGRRKYRMKNTKKVKDCNCTK